MAPREDVCAPQHSDEGILTGQIQRLRVIRRPSLKNMKTMPIPSKSSDVVPLRRLSSVKSMDFPEDFPEEDMAEFNGHQVEECLLGHLPSISQAPPTSDPTVFLSSTFGKLLSRRPRNSKRNPAAGVPFRSPLETVSFKVFSSSGLQRPSLEPGPLKVLLVEHNKYTRESLKVLLFKQNGCEPDLARDGSEALEMFRSYAAQGHIYFLILMDVVMPRMDGLQATQAIRRLELEKRYARTIICGMGQPPAPPNVDMDLFRTFHLVPKPLTEFHLKDVLEKAQLTHASR